MSTGRAPTPPASDLMTASETDALPTELRSACEASEDKAVARFPGMHPELDRSADQVRARLAAWIAITAASNRGAEMALRDRPSLALRGVVLDRTVRLLESLVRWISPTTRR